MRTIQAVAEQIHHLLLLVLVSIFSLQPSVAVPFIVQTLSSNYALVLGGYGPGYEELLQVEVVKHDKACSGLISDLPEDNARFLGDISGMAEYVNSSVIFCRYTSCWKLNLLENSWKPVGGFQTERTRAASVAVNDKIVILGGRDVDGLDIIGFEVYDEATETWQAKPEWEMPFGRYSFCAVPVNRTALAIVGGFSKDGPMDSVELLDTETGRWEKLPGLPKPRYGHTCLLMELAGREGILVSGGALTGSDVKFLDLKSRKWRAMPDTIYQMDGHKMVLVEGIPTVFAWDHTEQFDGKRWHHANFVLNNSRSAFTVTTVPGTLFPGCS